MSDFNGFRAYESAIIGGMLASGRHNLESVRDNFPEIRKTARKFSGSVCDLYYPIGAQWDETYTASQCLLAMLDTPRTLVEVMDRLMAEGFSEEVARYTYRAALSSSPWSYFSAEMKEVSGTPQLSLVKVVK